MIWNQLAQGDHNYWYILACCRRAARLTWMVTQRNYRGHQFHPANHPLRTLRNLLHQCHWPGVAIQHLLRDGGGGRPHCTIRGRLRLTPADRHSTVFGHTFGGRCCDALRCLGAHVSPLARNPLLAGVWSSSAGRTAVHDTGVVQLPVGLSSAVAVSIRLNLTQGQRYRPQHRAGLSHGSSDGRVLHCNVDKHLCVHLLAV